MRSRSGRESARRADRRTRAPAHTRPRLCLARSGHGWGITMNAPSALSVRVTRKAVEAEDICTFELTSADGTSLPSFSAGSHIDVQVPGGMTRQYSLCNDPAESHRYLIGVLR